jgi:hypothetical protein
MIANNSIWTLLLTALIPAGGAVVADHFGYSLKPKQAQKAEKPPSTPSAIATGVEGGIHINNYPPQTPAPQPVTQPVENSTQIKQPIPTEEKRLVSQNNTQKMRDGNINSPQINGGYNTVTDSSETNNIKKQTNTERNIETEQYNENNGSGNANCVGNNGTCSNNGTINNNPAR